MKNYGSADAAPVRCWTSLLMLVLLAVYVGQMNCSIFNESWWALVTRTSDGQNRLEINREVNWIGTGPP